MTAGPDFTLMVARSADWINANNRRRMHWSVDSELTRIWRTAAFAYARQARLPALGPSRVEAVLHMTARRRARLDPTNYAPTAKAVVDGLVDAGIWPDDNHAWVVGPDMRLGPAAKTEAVEGLELLIWGKPCCEQAACHHQPERVR